VTVGEDNKDIENKRRSHSIQFNNAAPLICKDAVVFGHAVKYVTETIEDMANVVSEIGSTVCITKPKYKINRKGK
jgi:hypothetical protein